MDPYKLLIYAIIDRALKDVRYGYRTDAKDAMKFLRSGYFEDMADVLKLEASNIRQLAEDIFEKRNI